MRSKEPEGHREVDTLRVGLLGFSLISIIVFSYPMGYLAVHSMASYQEPLAGILVDNQFIIGDLDILKALKTINAFMFILPQIISLILWFVMPTLIRYRYSLEALPSAYSPIDELVQELASKVGVPSPPILYNRSGATCFNMGKREGESTIVISEWLLTHLDSDELEAVLVHEMAHTRNRDVTLMAYFAAVMWAVLLSPLFIFIGFLYFSMRFGSSPLDFLFIPGFWVLVATFFIVYTSLILGIQWFSRLRETAADARTSFYVDKLALKRALYKVTCEKSTRMFLVSPNLMISGTRFLGSFLSTHPSLHKRYENLDKDRYIIDTGKPPSLRFCFTSALSIFIFTLFIGYAASVLYVFTTTQLPQDVPFAFLGPAITAFLLVSYYEYFSRKYIGAIIFLIAFIHFIVFFVLMLITHFVWLYYLQPVMEILPPESAAIVNGSTMQGKNLSEMVRALLEQRLFFLTATFLITGLLKYVRRRVNLRAIMFR